MSQDRPLTQNELDLVPFYLNDLGYSQTHDYYFATFGAVALSADQPEGPWTLSDGTLVTPENFIANLPKSKFLSDINPKTLRATYQGKQIRFSQSQGSWVYQNNHPVSFPSEPPTTPGPSRSHLPTPHTAGTSLQPPPAQPTSPSPHSRQNTPVQHQNPPAARNPAQLPPIMAAPQKFGSAPESFDGKTDKAETFLSQIENYYYLNEGVLGDESRRVSAALTHFKAGTPAGDWAQDRTRAALAQTPRDFGTWADFVAAFKAHFIPVDSQLEAGALMHNHRQGNKPFNEWYQTWYTHASRAGVDEPTKMFAFRRNLNPALHNKLLTLSPQPATLAALVEKARQFDQLYQLYNSPAFTQRGARVRSSTTNNDPIQINASGTFTPTQPRGPLSKEERERRFKEKLCLYCGKPNHMAKECRQKKNNTQGKRQGYNPPKIRATNTEETIPEEPPVEGLQISSFRTTSPVHFDSGILRPKSTPQDF